MKTNTGVKVHKDVAEDICYFLNYHIQIKDSFFYESDGKNGALIHSKNFEEILDDDVLLATFIGLVNGYNGAWMKYVYINEGK